MWISFGDHHWFPHMFCSPVSAGVYIHSNQIGSTYVK